MFDNSKRRFLVLAAVLSLLVAGGAVIGHFVYRRQVFPTHLTRVKRNVLYRSGQPSGQQWNFLWRHNIETVVDLCSKDENPSAFAEEVRECSAAGARFVNIPMQDDDITDEQLQLFLLVTRESSTTLVHCAQGRNRTGIMVAAYRVIVENWPADRAIREMKKHGWDPRNDVAEKNQIAMLRRMEHDRNEWLVNTAPDML